MHAAEHRSKRSLRGLFRLMTAVMAALWLCALPVHGQLSHEPNRHIVVLIDADPAITYRHLLDNGSSLPAQISTFLKDHGLYKEGDFLTVASYSFNLAENGGRNFNTFVTIPKGFDGKPLAWIQPKRSNPLGVMATDWASISNGQHVAKQPAGAARGSLNSMRLFFTMKAVSGADPNHEANSLYIVTISDDLHQGNDNIAGEFRTLFSISDMSKPSKTKLENEAKRFSGEVKRNFSFIDSDTKVIATGAFTNGTAFPYQIKVTEVRPTREPSIQNILHLPAMPELKRVRGGYSLNIKDPQVDSTYTLEKLELTLVSGRDTTTHTALGGKGLEVTIPFSMASARQPEATLRAWVRLNDGIYNSLVLSPYSDDNPGLVMSQRLMPREEAKIFGVLKVSDAFWPPFIKSYDTLVTIYTILLTFILTIAILVFGYIALKKIGTYEPKDKDIRLRHL